MEMGESARRAKAADEASAWLGARLGAGAPICLDGATGTELERRAENLATAGVDLILIETMNSVAEFETDRDRRRGLDLAGRATRGRLLRNDARSHPGDRAR
jgi:hypothetical protein